MGWELPSEAGHPPPLALWPAAAEAPHLGSPTAPSLLAHKCEAEA